jgi:TatD DNase family protein
VAVGECGLDYFYTHSPKEVQVEMLKAQIELALAHDTPLIFHVREAFDDFWPVFDSYQGIRGVLHSFTDTEANLQRALDKGLYIGVNGIATFTKIDAQKAMYKQIPLEKLLLETDAPFLTPVPHRGKVNEPAFVKLVASHMADLHAISLEELSAATSKNATTLFNLN